MWSSGFNLILTLGKSSYYYKVLCLLYGLGLGLVLLSGLPWYVRLIISAWLIRHGMRSIGQSIPTDKELVLSYQSNAWLCEQAEQEAWILACVAVLLNTRVFLLLKLIGIDGKQRILVVFGDQLTGEALRKLMWIQLIQDV